MRQLPGNVASASASSGGRCGTTLAEMLIAIGIIGLLAGLLLPAVQTAREASRQTRCRNNLRQLAMATHAHESAMRSFPETSVVSGDRIGGRPVALFKSISPHRHLLACLDPNLHQRIDWDDISAPVPDSPLSSISQANRQVMRASLPVFLCPSDSMRPGANNYRANMGAGPGLYHPDVHLDADGPLDPANRSGAFVNGNPVKSKDFRDGLSNTAMYSEKIMGDANRDAYDPMRDFWISSRGFSLSDDAVRTCRDRAVAAPRLHESFSGTTWFFGGWSQTWYNHVVGPNSPVPDCSAGSGRTIGGGTGLHTARSFHPGGVMTAYADGRVQFMSDDIAIDVWRAISTRSGAETVAVPR